MSEEGAAEKVPVWIISFADMITLLLAFFVMLQTMAKSRDNTLMGGVQRSFVLALAHMGLPDFLFEHEGTNVDHRRLRYPDEPTGEMNDQPHLRAVDPKEDQLSRLYRQIEQVAKTRSADASTRWLATWPLRTKFEPGSAGLPEDGVAAVAQYARELASNAEGRTLEVIIMASGEDVQDISEQWKLSAVRAGVLRDIFAREAAQAGAGDVIKLCPWGSGQGDSMKELAGENHQVQAVLIVLARD